jgi:hypothetical protein
MSDQPKRPDAALLLYDLQHRAELQQQPVAGVALDPQLAVLRTWQSQRLAQTYADLLADPHSGPACRFFLSDIYAPRDFSQRDHDIEQIYAFLVRVLPSHTLRLLSEVIELNRLTNALDNALCQVLVDQQQVTNSITPEQYAAGYRLCDNYDKRVQQINLITQVLKQVGAGSRLAVVGLAMKLTRGPALRAGWVELYDFLARGYAAFKQLRDMPSFVGAIDKRERRILDQIFAGNPEPFTV